MNFINMEYSTLKTYMTYMLKNFKFNKKVRNSSIT